MRLNAKLYVHCLFCQYLYYIKINCTARVRDNNDIYIYICIPNGLYTWVDILSPQATSECVEDQRMDTTAVNSIISMVSSRYL